jgi:hypothetical protein
MIIDNILTYTSEALKLKTQHPDNFSIHVLTKYFHAWQHSLNQKSNTLTDEQPWITFEAISFLKGIISDNMKVFEYGAGGSTLFFAKRAKEVISIEHDEVWFQNVSSSLEARGLCKTVNFHLVVPENNDGQLNLDPSEPESYASGGSEFFGYTFRNYAKTIDHYEDSYFDVVLIDGRARPACFKHAVSKVKKNGFLILDNSERGYYKYIHTSLNNKNWKKNTFLGPGPYNKYFWETCVWQRLA